MNVCEFSRMRVVKVLLGIYESLGLHDDLDEAIRACESSECKRLVNKFNEQKGSS